VEATAEESTADAGAEVQKPPVHRIVSDTGQRQSAGAITIDGQATKYVHKMTLTWDSDGEGPVLRYHVHSRTEDGTSNRALLPAGYAYVEIAVPAWVEVVAVEPEKPSGLTELLKASNDTTARLARHLGARG